MRFPRNAFLLFLMVVIACMGLRACSDPSNQANGDGGQDGLIDGAGGGDNNGQSDGNNQNGDGSGGDPGFIVCAEMNLESSSVPPNLLLVVDKSTSMNEATSQGSHRTKIQDSKDALTYLVDQGEGKIRFGWMQFPSSSNCTPGTVTVQCSDTSANDIRTAISGFDANGYTPTGGSLDNANKYSGLHDTTRLNFVVLLTDGMPNCSGNDPRDDPVAEQLALQKVGELRQQGIDTFIIGLGSGTSSNPDLLNQMADAGGRPRVGATRYFQANSLDELKAALDTIGGAVIGCNLTLNPIPEYPRNLWVAFDGVSIARDPNRLEGWEYNEALNQLMFFGNACERLRSGQVQKVDVKMGCSPPT